MAKCPFNGDCHRRHHAPAAVGTVGIAPALESPMACVWECRRIHRVGGRYVPDTRRHRRPRPGSQVPLESSGTVAWFIDEWHNDGNIVVISSRLNGNACEQLPTIPGTGSQRDIAGGPQVGARLDGAAAREALAPAYRRSVVGLRHRRFGGGHRPSRRSPWRTSRKENRMAPRRTPNRAGLTPAQPQGATR